MFLMTNAKFEPGSLKRNFCRSILTVCTTCTISLLPGIVKLKDTSTVEREYSKNNEKSSEIDKKKNANVKRPYLAQYTKIGRGLQTLSDSGLLLTLINESLS